MSQRTDAVEDGAVVASGPRPWPENCCATPDMRRKRIEQPIRWQDWIGCTNGHVLVAIKDDLRWAVADPFSNGDGIFKQATGPLVGDVVELPLAAFREWLGPATEPCPDCDGSVSAKECAKCDGFGFTTCTCWECDDEHEVECADCDGEGRTGCAKCSGRGFLGPGDDPSRRAMFRGKPFNMRVMALAVAGAPGDTVRLAWGSTETTAFQLEGDGWRGLVMPLRYEPEYDSTPIEVAPFFPARAVPTNTPATEVEG